MKARMPMVPGGVNPMQQMQNNPIAMMMQARARGGSPIEFLRSIAGQNPMAAQAIRLMQGKNGQQLQTMVENMARERGVSVEQIAARLGLQMPNK